GRGYRLRREPVRAARRAPDRDPAHARHGVRVLRRDRRASGPGRPRRRGGPRGQDVHHGGDPGGAPARTGPRTREPHARPQELETRPRGKSWDPLPPSPETKYVIV